MQPLFSIIITTYNSEKKIERAINSILNQTIDKKYFEIIVVDDCSIDNTVNLVNEYRTKYDNITVLQTPSNSGGPSEPRNIGIKNASGKFIHFLDSDDWFHEDTLSTILSNEQYLHSDIILGKSIKITNTTESVHAKFLTHKSHVNENPINIPYLFYYLGPHAKFINLELLKQNNILFPTNMSFGEDKLFFMRVYNVAKYVSISTKTFGYVDRTGDNNSIVKRTPFIQKRESDQILLNELLKLDDSEFKKIFTKRVVEYDLLRYNNSKTFLNLDDKTQKQVYQIVMESLNNEYVKTHVIPNVSETYHPALNANFDDFISFFTWLNNGEKICNPNNLKELVPEDEFLKNKNFKTPSKTIYFLGFFEKDNEILLTFDLSYSSINKFNKLLFANRTNETISISFDVLNTNNNQLVGMIKKDDFYKFDLGIYNIFLVYDEFKNLNIKTHVSVETTLNNQRFSLYKTKYGNLALKIH